MTRAAAAALCLGRSSCVLDTTRAHATTTSSHPLRGMLDDALERALRRVAARAAAAATAELRPFAAYCGYSTFHCWPSARRLVLTRVRVHSPSPDNEHRAAHSIASRACCRGTRDGKRASHAEQHDRGASARFGRGEALWAAQGVSRGERYRLCAHTCLERSADSSRHHGKTDLSRIEASFNGGNVRCMRHSHLTCENVANIAHTAPTHYTVTQGSILDMPRAPTTSERGLR